MNENTGVIYIVTNLNNRKQYVGQTVRKLKRRLYEHEHYNTSTMIHKAIKKYGIENFKWVSFSCPEEELDWQETFLIKELNTLAPNGYNLDSGGNEQKHRHEITKEKIAIAQRGEKSIWWGRKHTQEELNKMSLASVGKPKTEEHKIKMKKPKTEEHKIKLRNPHPKIQGENHPQARKVMMISPNKEIFIVKSYKTFCEKIGVDFSNMRKVFIGRYKYCQGWTGKYLDNDK